MQKGAQAFEPEEGLEPVVYRRTLRELLMDEPAFCCALNHATILMAAARGFVIL